jgi:hypothetical protein
VTQAYKTCLETSAESIGRKIAKGEFIDKSNNDLSMNQTHSAIGQKLILESMVNFNTILTGANMIELTKEELASSKRMERWLRGDTR